MAEHNSHKHQYKHTLHLPRTDFPIRAHSQDNDPKMVARWTREDLFSRTMQCNEGNQQFILHDGPPYANGHIHLGHAYNKILKDILAKARRMMGFHVPVVPGWDCHGLPIEQKVASEQPHLSRTQLQRACRDYALTWIDTQRDEFKRLGVLMDWQRPYVTMSYTYEASILESLAHLYEDGSVTRKNKTITWCPTCQTVLAAAEIEYEERKDPSIYVLFPVKGDALSAYAPEDKPLSVVIWTTTPWTIPLNRAVTLRPNTEYAIVDTGDHYVIVARALVDDVCDDDAEIRATFDSHELDGAILGHPLTGRDTPIILDSIADIHEGTGAVHTAPGCGPVDYELGVKHGLDIYSPIAPDGSYTDDIRPQELSGMSVSDGTSWVLRRLNEQSHLFRTTSLRHNYPHCWRCHNPLIFRATPQWFVDLETNNVKQRALDAISGIQFYPKQGNNFLYATVENRWEWCISRQRVWGVPIPALISKHGDPAYTGPQFIRDIAAKVEQHGIEYWDSITPEQLVQEGILPHDFPVHDYTCETDILDVWFDAGVSHYAVLSQWPQLAVPADLYLEGVDQHRGWFQSSLFTGIALHNQPPMRGIMTHGFTVDAQGHKMSKSRGNVVSPHDMMNRVGTDGLRLWVASIGNEGDAVVSDDVLTNVSQVYRKIRNTCRFLLQNLYDYDHARDAVAYDAMLPVDQYALQRLYAINGTIIEHYIAGDVSAVFHELADYVSSELSAFYMDVVKDRLYCEASNSHTRRSAQTAFWVILDTLTRLTAPILSFMSEQVSDHYQDAQADSIHLQRFVTLSSVWNTFADVGDYSAESSSVYEAPMVRSQHAIQSRVAQLTQLQWWSHIMSLRDVVLKAIEEQRQQGVVRHSLEARVSLYVDETFDGYDAVMKFMQMCDDIPHTDVQNVFQEVFVVSQVAWHNAADQLYGTECPGVYVRVEHAHGDKCPRCWRWSAAVAETGVCQRCRDVLSVDAA